jgi:predicted nucleic acid-binding protein
LKILVDTSAWIDFFNGVSSAARVCLSKLLEAEEEICISNYILAETLQGFRDDDEFERAKAHLLHLPILSLTTTELYISAAQLYRTCRKRMDTQTLVEQLKEIVGPENVLSSQMDLMLYSYDASLEKGKPDVVVLPGSTEEVSKIMALAYREKIPILGRGSGTNLTGGTIPVKGGIVVHFSE